MLVPKILLPLLTFTALAGSAVLPDAGSDKITHGGGTCRPGSLLDPCYPRITLQRWGGPNCTGPADLVEHSHMKRNHCKDFHAGIDLHPPDHGPPWRMVKPRNDPPGYCSYVAKWHDTGVHKNPRAVLEVNRCYLWLFAEHHCNGEAEKRQLTQDSLGKCRAPEKEFKSGLIRCAD